MSAESCQYLRARKSEWRYSDPPFNSRSRDCAEVILYLVSLSGSLNTGSQGKIASAGLTSCFDAILRCVFDTVSIKLRVAGDGVVGERGTV